MRYTTGVCVSIFRNGQVAATSEEASAFSSKTEGKCNISVSYVHDVHAL